MNNFVHYLNSLNNSDGNSKGALAESQITSPYFSKILVRRKISDFLMRQIVAEPCTIILTGHAGDGKTSLLAQLLIDLGCLSPGEMLKISDEVTSSKGMRVLYVKDMSELTKGKQETLLQQALDSPNKGISAILVSNTGPLINTMERLIGSTIDREAAVMELLDRMDTNELRPVSIASHSFYVINMARLDNVQITKHVFKNMLNPNLWLSCNDCEAVERCPIKNNQETALSMLDRISHFIEAFYRYLQEHDKRLTVRQIVAHLSFALTGNLDCKAVSSQKAMARFSYHFANLLFGYIGIKSSLSAKQIRAINEIGLLNLDTIGLKADYQMFVRGDYTVFAPPTADLLRQAERGYRVLAARDINIWPQYRRSIRRFYLVCSKEPEGLDQLLAEVYSPIFPIYLRAIKQDIDVLEKKRLENLVYAALYRIFTGVPPTDNDGVPLTVRRDSHSTQYVQLLKGMVPAEALSINVVKYETVAQDDLYRVVLQIGNYPFQLNYPILEHFHKVALGAVTTNLSPALSHGIDRLKANLVDMFSTDIVENQKRFAVLLQTNMGSRRLRCEIVGKTLYIQ